MSQFDTIYNNLCQTILHQGVKTPTRTGIRAIKIPSFHFRLNPAFEFPILTSKQVYIRQAVLEMLWIWQAQSNDVRWLQERDVHIWDLWQCDSEGNWQSKKEQKSLGKEYAYTIGEAYGFVVKEYGLMDRLLETLKKNPKDRRMVLSLWQEPNINKAVLPPCVWSTEWDVTDGKLNLWVHQRSADVPLGLPFNVTQYAVLQAMVAQVSGLEPGFIDWSIKDAHIYENQVAGIKAQLKRKTYPGPKLWLNDSIKDFYQFDNSRDCKDVALIGYNNSGPLKFKLAQ